MEGGLTRNEETLVDAGEEEAVRQYRQLFQRTMTKTVTEAIEEITGRAVIGYHSQIVFRPTRTFEIFVLAGWEDAARTPGARARRRAARLTRPLRPRSGRPGSAAGRRSTRAGR